MFGSPTVSELEHGATRSGDGLPSGRNHLRPDVLRSVIAPESLAIWKRLRLVSRFWCQLTGSDQLDTMRTRCTASGGSMLDIQLGQGKQWTASKSIQLFARANP